MGDEKLRKYNKTATKCYITLLSRTMQLIEKSKILDSSQVLDSNSYHSYWKYSFISHYSSGHCDIFKLRKCPYLY